MLKIFCKMGSFDRIMKVPSISCHISHLGRLLDVFEAQFCTSRGGLDCSVNRKHGYFASFDTWEVGRAYIVQRRSRHMNMKAFVANGVFNVAPKQEDIIWAIRQTTEKKADLSFLTILPAAASIIQFHKDSRHQLKGTLVPDEVILDINNYNPKQFNGSVLYGVTDGFSKLLAIYNRPMKGGPIRLVKVLNQYCGGIIDEILSHEGDLLYFSGDWFMAIWKSPNGSLPNDEVHTAINAALAIQKNFGKFETDGVHIEMKLTVTAGILLFSLIGDNESSHYVCIGKPVDDIIEAQQKCAYDEIIVAPSAWMYVNLAEFLALETEDGAHFKVLGIGPNWHLTSKEYTLRRDSAELKKLSFLISDEGSIETDEVAQVDVPSLRPMLQRSLSLQYELRKFIGVQILDTLEEYEPVESLIEMRNVVAMYINIVVKKCSPRTTVRVVDECFKIIKKNAKEYKGMVRRVKIFNKYITFTSTFGLRGLTNISVCSQALKCSMKCQKELNFIGNVQAVSIACTSGESYCGIFGHNLRKTYDVNSVFFHKAAKMIQAYPDIVTCDRKLFLHSQLEANRFTLMDYKRLEGIVNQGLIYEYNEEINEELENSILKFPLNIHTNCPILGRDNEVLLFQKLLRNFVKYFGGPTCIIKSAVIIEGYPKEGKSRLLIEFKDIARDVEHCEIILKKDDYLNVYGGVRKIIVPFLNLGKFSSEDDKKRAIRKSLGQSANTKFLCSLNSVFDVYFPVSQEYQMLTENEKRETLERRIQKLCKWCFKKPTLLSIDNAELMDEESWKLIPIMLQTGTVFLAAVLNKQKGLQQTNNLSGILKSQVITKISLKKIPKIYHAAIACQILGVCAMSADLENAIQSYSNGNPGWIENFMITLLQSKKIFIKSLDFKDIHDSGLVTPPLYMLKRLSPEQINKYKMLLEEKDEFGDNTSKLDQWSLFIENCRDEHTNVDIRKQIHEILCTDTEVRVCFMAKTFNVALDVDPEISDDMRLLELYDGMSYQEQQMLSCASVLGDLFTRSFIFYLWSPKSETLAGNVIQMLFEKGVLCCARADFSSGGDYIIQRHNAIDPTKDKSIECHCIGTDMDDSCIFMPSYASCGYMRFRSNRFRIIIYNGIPDNQKRDMHNKAAKYIQKETRRCVSCGSTYFPDEEIRRLDMTLVHGTSDKISTKKKTQLQQMNFEELYDYSNVRSTGGSGSSRDARQSVIPSLRASSVMKSYTFSSNSSGYNQAEHFSAYTKTPNIISPFTIIRLKNRSSLIRTFSKSNFVSCECHLILGHMHKRLKYHYKESGQWNKMIRSCIILAKLCIIDENYTTAVKSVAEAFEILENEKRLEGEPKWKLDMYLGILHSLSGKVLMSYDQVDEAYKKFLEAMRIFKYPFPVNKRTLNFHLKLFKQKWTQKLGLYFFPNFIVEDGDENEFQVMNCMSDTLCQLCRIYMSRNEWKLAELAAIWSLRNSLQTETSLHRICESFELMLEIALHNNNQLLMSGLEFHALRYCHKKTSFVEVSELKAIARLYRVIFESRICKAEYDKALHISYVALNLATTSNDVETGIRILILLPMILLRKMHIREMILMMHELEFFVNQLENSWGKMWYYALCVIFHLETGYTFVPFHTITSFYTVEGVKLVSKYIMSKMILVITMWLWNIRNNYWEAASLFNKEINTMRKQKIINNRYASALVYILEGTLLTFVNKINKRSIAPKAEMKKEVDRLFKRLYKTTSFAPSILSRLYHLEAYYAFVMNNEEKMKKMLLKARKTSLKYGLELELLHLEHSEKAWNKEISAAVRDSWKHHSSGDNFISYNDIDFENLKIHSFTLPTPIFRN